MGKSKIAKNYMYNLLYQVLLLVTPLITTPYISRVLGATNVGIYGFVSSIVAYFVLFGTAGTSLYGQREIAYYQDDPEKRTKIFREIFLIRMFLISIALAVYVFAFCIDSKYILIYRLMCIEIFANMFDVSWFFQGMQDFKKTVLRNVVIKIVGIALIFAFVKTEKHLAVYTLCSSVPVLVGHLSLWPYLPRYLRREKSKLEVRSHIKPIFALFIPQIAVEVYTVLDKTMIGTLCTDIAEVGYYTQAQKIIKIALKLVTSLGVVMLPAMALDYKNGKVDKLRESSRKSFKFMSFVGIPIMLGIIGISKNFVPWFFGNGYDPVGPLMAVTAPLIVVISYSTVIGSQYLLATKQQSIYTGSVIAGSCVNFTCNMLLIPKYGAMGASISSVLAEGVVSVIQVCFTRKTIPIIQYTLDNVKYYVSAVLMLFGVLAVGNYVPASILGTAIQIVTGAGIYFALMFVFKDEMMNMGISVLKRKIIKH